MNMSSPSVKRMAVLAGAAAAIVTVTVTAPADAATPTGSHPGSAAAGQPRPYRIGARSAATTPDGVVPDINEVTCGSRTDWLRLWTQVHGYPACFANNGYRYFGDNPPKTTWSSWGVCYGNNSGHVNFYWNGSWWGEDFKNGQCDNWSKTLTGGHVVEVKDISITGR